MKNRNAVIMSSAVGAVLGMLILAVRRQGRSQPLPFGPYLAAAGWIVLLWGDAISAAVMPGLGG
ncbi:MAG: A24 family peptidase [Pseudomonadota bacterium]